MEPDHGLQAETSSVRSFFHSGNIETVMAVIAIGKAKRRACKTET